MNHAGFKEFQVDQIRKGSTTLAELDIIVITFMFPDEQSPGVILEHRELMADNNTSIARAIEFIAEKYGRYPHSVSIER